MHQQDTPRSGSTRVGGSAQRRVRPLDAALTDPPHLTPVRRHHTPQRADEPAHAAHTRRTSARRTPLSRPGTPRSGRGHPSAVAFAATAAVSTPTRTQRQGSQTATPSRHAAAARTRRRTTSRSQVAALRSAAGADSPVARTAAAYGAPPPPSPSLLHVAVRRRRSTASNVTSRRSSASKQPLRQRSPSLVSPAVKRDSAHRARNGTPALENEPFSEAPSTRTARGDASPSPSPPVALVASAGPGRKTPRCSSAPTPTGQETPTASAAVGTARAKATTALSDAPAAPLHTMHRRHHNGPLTSERASATTVRGDEARTSPSPSDPLTSSPTPSAFQLPMHSYEDVRRLYASLLLLPDTDAAVWTLHGQILPFLAAHASVIMPASPRDLLRMLGEEVVPVQTHQEKLRVESCVTDRQAQSIARFATEVCAWFFYVGSLRCGAKPSWETLLGGDGVAGGEKCSLRQALGDEWGVTAAKDHEEKGTQGVAGQTDTVKAVCEDAEAQDDKDTTVLWETVRAEQSLSTASFSFASVDFRCQIETPTFVEREAFVLGVHMLRCLLGSRAVRTPTGALKDSLLCSVSIALRSAADDDDDDSAAASTHVPPNLRAGLRRLQFYFRLHAFMVQLCAYCSDSDASPGLRDSQMVESLLRSRLSFDGCVDSATPSTSQSSSSDQRSGQQEARHEDRIRLPLTASWLTRTLIHNELHRAIMMSTNPAASTATRADGAAPSAPLPNTLDMLLTLRHREGERVVRSATAAAVLDGFPRRDEEKRASSFSAKVATTAAATAASGTQRALPPSLLLLFAAPRWTPWWTPPWSRNAGDRHVSTEAAAVSTPSTPVRLCRVARDMDGASVCLFAAAVLITVLAGPLLYALLRHTELPWTVRWSSAATPSCWPSTSQLLVLVVILLGTARIGSYCGVKLATLAVQQLCVRAQVARLTTAPSSMWLYTAWALRTENVVAAAAAHHCLARLQVAWSVARSAALTPSQRLFLSTKASVLLPVVLLLLLWRAVQQVLLPLPHHFIALGDLAALLVVSWQSVASAWQRRADALRWRLHSQPLLAEGLAEALLSAAAHTGGCAVTELSEDGQVALRPALRSAALSPSLLCVAVVALPLPLLQELAKVAYVMEASESRSRQPSAMPDVSVQAVSSLEGFACRCFWERLCGHAAVAYGGVDTAVAVVDRTRAACAKMVEELEAKAGQCAKKTGTVFWVESLLSSLLPWSIPAEAQAAADTAAHDDDDHLVDVVGSLRAASPPVPLNGASSVSDGRAGKRQSSPGQMEPLPSLDLRLRFATCLSLAQRRLLVCVAALFVVLLLEPPRLMRGDPERADALTGGGGGEGAFLCLVRLVYGQRSVPDASGHCGASAGSSAAGRWREAERRARQAVLLLYGLVVREHRCSTAYGLSTSCVAVSAVPQLLHVLFDSDWGM